MRLPDVIKMVEKVLKQHVTKDVISRALDAIAIDLLPDLSKGKSLTTGLKCASPPTSSSG